MVRPLDTATQTAVRDRSRVVRVNLVWITAKTGAGSDISFGFTDYGEDITTNVVDGETGSTVSRSFYGDEAPIVRIDPIPMKIGLGIETVQVVLNPLHAAVETMFRGNDIRNAPVQIYRGMLDPDSGLFASNPRCRHLGQINEAPVETAAVGGTSSITLKVVSHTRELTRTSTLKWSDESQRLRSDDRFLRYVGNTEDVPWWWGEESGTN